MNKKFLCPLFFLLLFASCQTLYTYRLPNDSEKRRFGDSLHWGYSGNTIISVPVSGDNGRIFRLPVTPKTKIEVKTEEGLAYRFYLRGVKIEGEPGLLSSSQTWSGYELLNHTPITISVREVSEIKILSEEKAVVLIAMP